MAALHSAGRGLESIDGRGKQAAEGITHWLIVWLPTSRRTTFEDHFAGICPSERGIIDKHGLDHVDWSPWRPGELIRSAGDTLARLKDEKKFYYGGCRRDSNHSPEGL